MNDRLNIKSGIVNVYLAAAGTDHLSLSSWFNIGYMSQEGPALIAEEHYSFECTDFDFQLASKYVFSANMMQTKSIQLSSIEALLNQEIDILISWQSNFPNAEKLTSFELSMSPEFLYSYRESKRLKIEAVRVAKNLSDLHSEVNLLNTGSEAGDLYGDLYMEDYVL